MSSGYCSSYSFECLGEAIRGVKVTEIKDHWRKTETLHQTLKNKDKTKNKKPTSVIRTPKGTIVCETLPTKMETYEKDSLKTELQQ